MSATTQQDERLSLLDKLLGRDQDNELKKALSRVSEILKKRGHENKELKDKGMLEDMREEFTNILNGISDNVPEGAVDQLVATAIGIFANTEPAPEEEAPETMMEEDKPEDEDEEEKPTLEQFMELTAQVKTLAAESSAIYKDVGEFIPSIIQMAQTVAQLAPLVKEAGKIDALVIQVKALESKVSARPRQASQAAATVIENEKLAAEINKGVNGKKTFFGVPLKEE